MDSARVDVDASASLFGSHAIQLPPGVGELIPNLLFIGPHGACEEMVNRFGVRYVIDVLDDEEVVSTARENKYEEKSVQLQNELEELHGKIVSAEKELMAVMGQMDEEGSDEEQLDAASQPAESTALAVAGAGASQDEEDDTPLPPVDPTEGTTHSTQDGQLTVSRALDIKKRFLQLVAAIRSGTAKLEELHKQTKDHQIEKEAPPAGDDQSTVPADDKTKNDYVSYQDCHVISPITATEGYRVVYPSDLSLLHFKMKDAMIEDLTRVLHMGCQPPTTGGPTKRSHQVDEVAPEEGKNPNGFVTMEELLAEYPTPVYSPPYELVDHIDGILSQNPSESELTDLGTAAIRKLAAARKSTAQLAGGAPPVITPPAFNTEPTIVRHAVYIHCYAGKSRSATIATAYSMLSKMAGHKKLDEVMDLLMFMTPITIKRPQGYVVRKGQGCRPNPRFMRDLIALEKQVQTALQSESGIPSSRLRPFETSFDIDTFNVEGLVELFNVNASPNAQIPEAVIIDTYEKVCHGDVIRARRLLVAEQTRLLISPKVRQDMIIDNIVRVLDQDIDYYVIARQKATEEQVNASAEDRKKIEEKLKALHVSFPRHVVAQLLEQCNYDEEATIDKLREMRKSKGGK